MSVRSFVSVVRTSDARLGPSSGQLVPGWKGWSPLEPTREPVLHVGIDAAIKHDTCACVAVFRDGDQVILALHKIWRPSHEAPLDLREHPDRVGLRG